MGEIQCGFAHKALTAIDEAEEGARLDLDYRVVASLKEKGLVSAYSSWFYQEMVSSAAELKKLGKRLKETQDEVTGYESGIKYFEKCLGSSWGYTQKELQDMREQLEDRRCKREERSRTAERLESKVERLGAMPAPAEGYRLTIDGDYVMLTEKGSDWMKILPGRLQRLWNAPLEVFEQEWVFESRIEACYSRFIEMIELMESRGFGKRNQQVIHCAALLSTAEGTIPWLYGRMRIINDYLYNDSPHHEGLKGYGRLFPAASVAMQPGDIEMLKVEFTHTYNALVKENYLKNSFTWWLASSVMELNGFDVEKNIERYDSIRKAVAKNGWEMVNRHTCYAAASLARGQDSPEELARNLRTQQLRLANLGGLEGSDLGTAALILLDSGLSLEERTDRFLKTFEEMAASGWEKHTHFYPAAAALSLLPGSAAENVIWLSRIIKRLRADGFADETVARAAHKDGLTYRALPFLMAAYRGRFGQEVMPSIITHSKDSFFKNN